MFKKINTHKYRLSFTLPDPGQSSMKGNLNVEDTIKGYFSVVAAAPVFKWHINNNYKVIIVLSCI